MSNQQESNINKASGAISGLAMYSISMIFMQLFNIGVISIGPIVAVGFIVGGFIQLRSASCMQHTQDSFSYALFSYCSAFWLSLGAIWFAELMSWVKITDVDMGMFFAVWSILGIILAAIAIRIDTAHALLQIFNAIGMVGLASVQFGCPYMMAGSVMVLTMSAIVGLYIVFALLYNSINDNSEVSLGSPWVY
jgi:succinate-acetate transporter protein